MGKIKIIVAEDDSMARRILVTSAISTTVRTPTVIFSTMEHNWC